MVGNLVVKALASFDGPDGCGKSTLLAEVIKYLTSRNIQVHKGPTLGDFLPTGNNADAFRDWILSTNGLDIANALIGAASRRIETILKSECAGAHILLIDRGSLTIRLSAITHGMGTDERSEQQVLIALTDPLKKLAYLDKKMRDLVPVRTVVILPRFGMRTIEHRLSVNEVISDRYFRYLSLLHDQFRPNLMGDYYVVAAEDELRKNAALVGELLLNAASSTGTLHDTVT
jgi:hypothetical protein